MKKGLLLLLLGAVSAGIAHADIFRYVDADGAVHFTNVPQDSRFKVYLKEKRTSDPVAETLASEIRHSASWHIASEIKSSSFLPPPE